MKGIRPPKDIDGLNWFQLGILDTVRHKEGLSLKELAQVLGESPQVINYHLKLMILSGLIRKEREGKTVRHYVGDFDEDELDSVGM